MEVNSTYCGKSNQLDTCVYWGCPLVIQQNFGKIISFPNHPIKNICVIICPISLNNVFCTNAEQTCLSTSIMIVLFVKKNKITPTANLFLEIVSHFSLNSFQKIFKKSTIVKRKVNLLSANPTKWSNTLKQFVGNSWRRVVWMCLTILPGWSLKG